MQNRISNGHLTNIKSENNVTNIEIKFVSPLDQSPNDRYERQLQQLAPKNLSSTVRTTSTASGISDYVFHTSTPSSVVSDDQMGPNSNYVDSNENHNYSPKKVSCMKKLKILLTAISTISLSIAFNNTYRLPREIYLHGGVTFLVAYYVLSLLVGFPLIFLEFGIGQLIQANCLNVWKAVPLFKGVGILKIFVMVLLGISLPIQTGLAIYYFLWTINFGLPFPQCSSLGNITTNNTAESCLQKTFLLFPSNNHNPYYFGMFVAVLFLLWFLLSICLYGKDVSYKVTTTLCYLSAILGFGVLYTIAVFNDSLSLQFIYQINWQLLLVPEIWFYAMIQVLLSTHLSFGHLETCFGHVFNKNNFFWSAIFYQLFNILMATVSFTAINSMIKNQISVSMTDVMIHLWIYESAILLPKNVAIIFTCCYYLLITVSGICSMLTIVYVLGRVINMKIKKWILVINLISITGFILSSCILLVPKLQLINIFDSIVISRIVYLITIIQLVAFVGFYGCKNIYSDFEFILGQQISRLWRLFWVLDALALLGIYFWKLMCLKIDLRSVLELSVDIAAILVVIVFAFGQIVTRSDYNIVDKVKSALKSDRKWGPIDPIRRRDWVQWREKIDDCDGRRDFTLKRRATRDYTNSIMKNTRRRHRNQRSQSVLSPNSISRPPGLSRSHTNSRFRLTSIIDSFENQGRELRDSKGSGSVQTSSEGYGTIRNGSYVFRNKNIIEL